MKLAMRCESFVDHTSIVADRELSDTMQVVSVHDVPAGDRVHCTELVHDYCSSIHSIISPKEAEAIIVNMPIGWVGIFVTVVASTVFLKKNNDVFDCISLTQSGEWGARTQCQASCLLGGTDTGAELIILRKKIDLFI